jgi:AraC family transcriptional regulator, positive regulator of tynA and feaB
MLTISSTDAVPPRQRADYWYESVLSLLDVNGRLDKRAIFHARFLRISTAGAKLLQHSSSSLQARRDAKLFRRDGCDDIVIDVIASASGAGLVHAGSRRLQTGDMVVMDCAQPVEMTRGAHRVISLFLPRALVQSVCPDPASLAGRLLPRQGLAALLRLQMLSSLEQAPHMLPAQRVVAINAARDMALSLLQMQQPDAPRREPGEAGLHHAALLLIARNCTNPQLTPQHIAQRLGCSRATLYRAFAAAGSSVAASIWEARLGHAARLLQSPAGATLLIVEIALRSGFADHSGFAHMFKRRYSMTPGDMRQSVGQLPRRDPR